MKITLVEIPYDQDKYMQGVGLAPRALLAENLRGSLKNIGVDIIDEVEIVNSIDEGDQINFLGNLGRKISNSVIQAHTNKSLPVILGGDCLNAIGVTAGLQHVFGESGFGIAWADAHGDFNTPDTTLSGFLPGMALASLCGFGLPELREQAGLLTPMDIGHVIMLGTRDLDPVEMELLKSTPISYLNPAEVAAGSTRVAAGYHFQDLEGIYLHIDMDVIDPSEAPGVDFKVDGGISEEVLLNAIKDIQAVSPLLAVSLSSINPLLDKDGITVQAGIRLLTEILKP